MDLDERANARRLHYDLEFIGLRAQATSVGLLQLCAELVKAGVLDGAAVQRIKDAIHSEISVSNRRVRAPAEFEETLRARLDAIFPRCEDARRTTPIGDVKDLQAALQSEADASR